MTIDPHEIQRQVVLALVLEPLAEKSGCTTRTVDLSPTIKLQHLQTAAVNVGGSFYKLAERVRDNQEKQPETYFDLALEALSASQLNLDNEGKFINQGLIAMMFHVVLSGLLVQGDGVAVCKNVTNVLQKSSPADGNARNDFRQKVVATSRNSNKRQFPNIEAVSLADWYEKSILLSRELGYESGAIWAEDLLNGMPMLQEMYLCGSQYQEEGLLTAIEKSYEVGTRYLKINSPGFVADYTGLVAYLLVRDETDSKIIK